MIRLNKGIVTALAALVATGCDPFDSEPGGTPTVVGVVANAGGAIIDATGAGGAWTLDGMPSACNDTTGAVTIETPVIFVRFNKHLDGFSVQDSPATCEPAGDWLTVTPAATGTTAWYSCYNPSSPSPTEGISSVVIYPAPATPASVGWSEADQSGGATAASGTVITTVTYAGQVADKGGTAADIDVTANFDPNPGTAGDPTFGTTTATSVVVNWTAPGCNAAAQYVLERAPNVPGATPADDEPGAFAQVGAGNIAALTFTDTGLTAATKYWYHVTAVTVIGTTNYPGATSDDVAVTTAP